MKHLQASVFNSLNTLHKFFQFQKEPFKNFPNPFQVITHEKHFESNFLKKRIHLTLRTNCFKLKKKRFKKRPNPTMKTFKRSHHTTKKCTLFDIIRLIVFNIFVGTWCFLGSLSSPFLLLPHQIDVVPVPSRYRRFAFIRDGVQLAVISCILMLQRRFVILSPRDLTFLELALRLLRPDLISKPPFSFPRLPVCVI